MIKKMDLKKTISMVLVLFFVVSGVNGSITSKKTLVNADTSTLYVGGTGPGNYSSIQSALENSSNGDTIFVYRGTYKISEDIGIYQTIQLIGENVESVIIENRNKLKSFYIFADEVSISNLTFHNIRIINHGNKISMHDNIFFIEQFTYELLSGVIESNGNKYNTFSGNTIDLGDRSDDRLNPTDGIKMDDETATTIHNNTISNALVGINIIHSKSLHISDNTLTNNNLGISIISSFTNYDEHHIVNNNFLKSGSKHASVLYSVSNVSLQTFMLNIFINNVPCQNFTHNYWDDHQSSKPRMIDAIYYVHILTFFDIYVIDITTTIPKYEVDPHPASSPFVTSLLKGGDL